MLNPAVKKKQSPIDGCGLIAETPIRKGEVIWKLDEHDRIFTPAQGRALPPEVQLQPLQYGDRYILNDGMRFINHSCDPTVWCEGDDTMVARRDIAAGEELAFDYPTREVEPPYRFRWRCRCGARNCRKSISSRDCLDKKFQEIYKGHMPSWVLDYIRNRSGFSAPPLNPEIFIRHGLTACLLACAAVLQKAAKILISAAAGVCDVEEVARRTGEEWDQAPDFLLDEEPVLSGFREWEKPVLSFLEPQSAVGMIGCGSGRGMLAWSRFGYAVDGVDAAPRAIDAAKKNLARAGVPGRVYCADIFHFKFPAERYGAFIFSWPTYGLIPSSNRRIAVLRRLREQLKDGGCMMLTVEPCCGTPTRSEKIARRVGRLAGNPVPPRAWGPIFPAAWLQAFVHARGDRERSPGRRAYSRRFLS